jgi:hypothetical protein
VLREERPGVRYELLRGVGAERDVSVLERMQMALAAQLDEPLEVLLATALLALGPLPEIAVAGLPVTF